MEGIPLFLKYDVSIQGYERFWEGLKAGEVWTTKCKKCGTIYYPPQRDCPNCLSSDMEWIKLKENGKIMTFSIVKQKPQGFDQEDYVVGIVRNEDNVDLMCWLKGIPKVGKDVKLTTDGKRVIGVVV
ncbi:DNA-binding protein [Candidatus Acidianus copahuensis]|uniref:DNA-binding protein n=1 Tax=Candidatus Acidianus copahuensis TaxID=1160895 RepID=A0A031LI01_9CREN|nr:Zn-ribbon domain-containing OB-fold protein [Candidatus Acidianus copahuensis]EZQ01782.1 DNA-binding protein [Candidatus Acidianus copahuensis]